MSIVLESPIIDPRIKDVVIELGHWILRYSIITAVFRARNVTFNDDKWNRLVREQVKKCDDTMMDLSAAFDLMEEQNNCCKRCHSYFVADSDPSLYKSVKFHNFLGMRTCETKYSWICEHCRNDSRLEDRIAMLLKEEDVILAQ